MARPTPLTDKLSFSRAITKLSDREHWQEYAAAVLEHARTLEQHAAALAEALADIIEGSGIAYSCERYDEYQLSHPSVKEARAALAAYRALK